MIRFQKDLIFTCVLILLIILIVYVSIKLLPVGKWLLMQILYLLSPFVIAAIISYVLAPIVKKLTELKLTKGFAILFIYVLFFGSGAILFYYGFPMFIQQLEELSSQIPQFIFLYEQFIQALDESTSFLPEAVRVEIDTLITRIETKVEEYIASFLEQIAELMQHVIMFLVIPVLVFYFLHDYDTLKRSVMKLLPSRIHQQIEVFLSIIDYSFGSYIRGQLLVSTIVTVMTFLIYHSIQLKYALVLAIIMGLMNVIPYFGPIIGTIPAVSVALTMSWKAALVVICTTIVVQILEGSFFSPYIMGKSVQVHPVFIIFALLLGSQVAGLLGMFLAVPILTVTKSIVLYIIKNKQLCN